MGEKATLWEQLYGACLCYSLSLLAPGKALAGMEDHQTTFRLLRAVRSIFLHNTKKVVWICKNTLDIFPAFYTLLLSRVLKSYKISQFFIFTRATY